MHETVYEVIFIETRSDCMRLKIFVAVCVMICLMMTRTISTAQTTDGSNPTTDSSTPPKVESQPTPSSQPVQSEVQPNQPLAFVPKAEYEFSPVVEGVEVTYDFIIQNKGTAPLIIDNVKTG